jgi:GNAT superfamily N-acetyltransferase
VRRCLGTGTTPRTLEFWRWKHLNNPFGPSPGLVAIVGHEAVAMRVFMRWAWTGFGRDWRSGRAVDTVTHPDWRRRGLFRTLTRDLLDRLTAEGIDFIFNTPNAQSGAGYASLGWKELTRVPLLVKPLRPWSLWTRSRRPGPESDKWRPPLSPVSEVLESENMIDLLSGNDGRLRLSTIRSPEYLQWRYGDVPGINYYGSSARRAVVVTRARHRAGLRELAITESFCGEDPRDEDDLVDLLRSLCSESGADHAIACASRDTVERDALLRAGFIPVPFGVPRLMLRALQTHEPPGEADQWRLSLGDLELF